MPSDFWQNDRALLRATAVTRGGTDIEKESAQKVNYSEENSPAAPAGTRTRNFSITSPTLCKQAVSAPSSGSTRPQSSQLAESLWTDPGLKDKSGVRKLISTLKQNNLKTRRRGMNRQTFPYSRLKGGTMPLHHHHIDLKIKC